MLDSSSFAASLPLSGIRVVELGTFITGPCAGMMLADMGADVIKVEGKDGDPYRAYQVGNYSPHFQAYNRNKRSIALDLKSPADQSIFQGLVEQADVFIQNFRPGTAARLNAGPQHLLAANPKLIYCSISGFGSSGPYVERPSYDSVAQALSGFLSVVVDSERPRFLGPALADAITGMYAAYGILGALVRRGTTGKGGLVEISMLEAMAHFAVEPFAAFFALGASPRSDDRPRLAQAYILRTSDGGLIAIHLSSIEKFWSGLVAALGAGALAEDTRFRDRLSRIANYEALNAELAKHFSLHTREELARRLAKNDVPYAPINTVDEVVQDPQVVHLNLIVPTHASQGASKAVRPAVQFDGQHATQVLAAPLINEHGAAIRAALAESTEWPAS